MIGGRGRVTWTVQKEPKSKALTWRSFHFAPSGTGTWVRCNSDAMRNKDFPLPKSRRNFATVAGSMILDPDASF